MFLSGITKPFRGRRLNNPERPLWFGESGGCLRRSWGFHCGSITCIWHSWNSNLRNTHRFTFCRSSGQFISSHFSPEAAAGFSFTSCCWKFESLFVCIRWCVFNHFVATGCGWKCEASIFTSPWRWVKLLNKKRITAPYFSAAALKDQDQDQRYCPLREILSATNGLHSHTDEFSLFHIYIVCETLTTCWLNWLNQLTV